MPSGETSKLIGAALGLCGFAVGVIAGMAADNPVETVLTRALVALVVCFVAGSLIGAIGERVVDERVGVPGPAGEGAQGAPARAAGPRT